MYTPLNFRTVIENYLATHPQMHVYFLLDHAGLPNLMPQLRGCRMQWVSLFDATRESTALAVAPLIVFVASQGTPLPSFFLDWIAQNGAFTSSVTLLASPLAMEALQQRLLARLDIKLSEDMDAMLRFFDPRILAQLRVTLIPEQADAFFSVAAHWWYIDRAGLMAEFDAAYAPVETACIPLVLNQQQEFELLDASEPDQVLALLDEQVPGLMAEIAPGQRHGMVVSRMAGAKAVGLHSVFDFVTYTAAFLINGSQFLVEKFPSHVSTDDKENSTLFRQAMMASDIES